MTQRVQITKGMLKNFTGTVRCSIGRVSAVKLDKMHPKKADTVWIHDRHLAVCVSPADHST